MDVLVFVSVLFLVALSACFNGDIIDMMLEKMCHEHEGIQAMTKPFLHERAERIIKLTIY